MAEEWETALWYQVASWSGAIIGGELGAGVGALAGGPVDAILGGIVGGILGGEGAVALGIGSLAAVPAAAQPVRRPSELRVTTGFRACREKNGSL